MGDEAVDSLQRHFERRGIEMQELAAGIGTPLRFSDAREEHWATRRAAGLFDFSFMACFEATGPGVIDYLQAVQTRDVTALSPGGIAYTLLCRDDGSVLNDATVWRFGDGRWWLFTGRRSDRRHLLETASRFDLDLADRSAQVAVLAVQGPRSREVLARGDLALAPIPYFRFVRATLFGFPCHVARIGYSGETGYEIAIDRALAASLWQRLVDAGRSEGLRECGFEAIDSLRIEAGHILFARELALRLTPYELGLGRLVSRHGADYRGAAALRASRYRQPSRRLVGLLSAPTGPAAGLREAMSQRAEPAEDVAAIVTSVAHSPVFGCDIALGLVPWEQRHAGTLVRLRNATTARVARLPFYDPPKALPRSGHAPA